MSAFLGMRGTGDWATDQDPKDWLETVLYLYPNGMAPLTAILSKMKKRATKSPEFNWWTKALPAQGGAVTNVYTDVALATAYAAGDTGVEDDTVYAKVAEAVADEFRTGHVAMLRDASNLDVDCRGEVTAVVKNGDSSYIAVKLLEDDDGHASDGISTVDKILIVGNVNAEGAGAPDGINYDPTKYTNFTQIFRNPTEITGTAEEEELRTGDQKAENRRETLELHSMEMEKSFLWSVKTEKVGANGKKKRTTLGMIPMVQTYTTSDNVDNYAQNSDYSGQSWLDGGEDWLDEYLANIFKWGATEKLGFCGTGALRGVNRLAKTYGNIQLTPMTVSYGLKVVEWITPFGILYLKTHPLFSHEATNTNAMIIFEPKRLVYRNMRNRDTKLHKDIQDNDVDGTIDEYRTEAGLEYHHVDTFGYLTNVGVDSAV